MYLSELCRLLVIKFLVHIQYETVKTNARRLTLERRLEILRFGSCSVYIHQSTYAYLVGIGYLLSPYMACLRYIVALINVGMPRSICTESTDSPTHTFVLLDALHPSTQYVNIMCIFRVCINTLKCTIKVSVTKIKLQYSSEPTLIHSLLISITILSSPLTSPIYTVASQFLFKQTHVSVSSGEQRFISDIDGAV